MPFPSENIGIDDFRKKREKRRIKKQILDIWIFIEIILEFLSEIVKLLSVFYALEKSIKSTETENIFFCDDEMEGFLEWIVDPKDCLIVFQAIFSVVLDDKLFDESIKNLMI